MQKSGVRGLAAKDFCGSRKYTGEDAETIKGVSMADEEQSSLISALKQRDRAAWSAVVERHLQEVYGFFFHLVGGNPTVAEDLNQEIWLEALDGIDQCSPDQGNFRSWVFGIARKRVALHYRRRALSGNPTSLSEPFGEATEWPAVSVLPEDVLEQVEKRSVMRAAILRLPDDRRKVLLEKYVEGFSVEAIAKRMGRTAKAVESLLSRAREQVRSLLGGYLLTDGDQQRVSKESSYE